MSKVHKAVVGLLWIASLILAHFIFSKVPGRLDLTAERIYSISEGTREVLRKIEEPIHLRFFFSRSSEGLPVRIKNYADRVEQLLQQYIRASGGRITVETIDPRPDTEAEEQALAAGLRARGTKPGESIYFGMQAIQADREAVIPFFHPDREPFIEYDLSRNIQSLLLIDQPVVGLITSLPMEARRQPGEQPSGVRTSRDWYFLEQLRKTTEVRRIRGNELPDELDLLLILHPRGLSETLKFSIDQAFLSGIPTVVAVDPSSIQARRAAGQQADLGTSGPSTSSLEPLLGRWGVDFDPSKVVGDLELGQWIHPAPDQPPVQYPVWIQISDATGAYPFATGVRNILLPEAGSFRLEPPAGVTAVPLLTSSTRAGEMMASGLRHLPLERVVDQILPDNRERIFAAVLEGMFPTAYPEGSPRRPGEDDFLAELRREGENFFRESVASNHLVVFADTDFFSDDFALQPVSFLGQESMLPGNDNLSLILGAIDYLLGSEALLSIRSSGSATRPFTRVHEMERWAREDYRKKLANLDRELADIREKMRQLHRTGWEEASFGLPGDIQQAIETFQGQEAALRASRREIRRQLREDVEKLDRSLALTNVIVVPGLIALFGFRFFYRRNRARYRQP